MSEPVSQKALAILAECRKRLEADGLDQAPALDMPAKPGQPPGLTSKIMVLRFRREDYATMEALLKFSQETVPTLTMDDMCASLLTTLCRQAAEKQGKPA